MSSAISPAEERAYDDFSRSFQQSTLTSSMKRAFEKSRDSEPVSLQSILPEKSISSNQNSIKDIPFIRTPAFPIENLKGSLPHAEVATNVDHASVASSCIKKLNHFNTQTFTGQAIWRDVYALTGTVRTFNGAEQIQSVWTELSDLHHQSGFNLISGSSKVVRLDTNCSWIQARFSFDTAGQPEALCSGQIGIVPDRNSGWKIWLLTTILEEIKGFPSPDFIGPQATDETISEPAGAPQSSQFDCVVVGAGFGGLCLAGRLKAIGVRSVTLERNANIGDNWTNRYESARCKIPSVQNLGSVLTIYTVHTSKDYSNKQRFTFQIVQTH